MGSARLELHEHLSRRSARAPILLVGRLQLGHLCGVRFACVFIANKLAEPTFPDGIVDKTPVWRSTLHWLGSLPTIVGYCSVELYGFLVISIQGGPQRECRRMQARARARTRRARRTICRSRVDNRASSRCSAAFVAASSVVRLVDVASD